MSAIATAVRPSWHELPCELREGLVERLGEIASAQVQTGGFTPGLAARLRLTTGERIFVKGIGVDHVLAGKYMTEGKVGEALPARLPAPRLRWQGEVTGWFVLVFDDVDGRHPDLSPGSPDVTRVASTVAGLSEVLTPCPIADAPPATVELADIVHGWRELAAGPPADLDDWTRRHLLDLADLETRWLAAADGETLLHGDINRSNLLVNRTGDVWVIDWAQPVRGAAWVDVADLVPHLILAGHTPADAEKALTDVAVWRDTDPDVITSYAAAFAGYWTRMSYRPAPPGVPNLRGYQARAARAAIGWTAHRAAGA